MKKSYRLYDTYTTYFILGGLAFMNVMVIGLLVFFIKRMIVIETERNLAGYILIAMFLAPIFYIDIWEEWQTQLYSRYLVRCRFDKSGILCGGLFIKKRKLPWEKIRTYGIVGYGNKYVNATPYSAYGLLFISLDEEPYRKTGKIEKEQIAVNKRRLVFQIREEIWEPLSEYMPEDMKKLLWESIEKQRNCFARRKVGGTNK